MRFDIPVPCFFGNMDFCAAIEKIAALGFDAAETYNWQCLDIPAVRAACEQNGVELLSVCTSEFTLTDAAYRERYLRCLRESCAAARSLGAKMLITQVGADTGEERARQQENIIATLALAHPILEDAGITLLVEPLNALYNHKGYYLTRSDEAFAILRAVDSPFVKLVFDIYHQQVTEGNLLNNMLDNLGQIGHLHAAGHPGRHDLQEGETDYRFLFRKLDAAGYKGACGLEYNPLGDAAESLAAFRKLYL